MTVVVGVDFSLTGTGVVRIRPEFRSIEGTLISSRPVKGVNLATGKQKARWYYPIADRAARLSQLEQRILHTVGLPDLAVVEAPAHAARHGSPHERGGLWWGVVTELWRREVTVVEVPPANRAKYATGNGQARKESVVSAMLATHTDLGFTNHNIIDGLILAEMGCRWLGHPIDNPLPEDHLTAMSGVVWPTKEGNTTDAHTAR